MAKEPFVSMWHYLPLSYQVFQRLYFFSFVTDINDDIQYCVCFFLVTNDIVASLTFDTYFEVFMPKLGLNFSFLSFILSAIHLTL